MRRPSRMRPIAHRLPRLSPRWKRRLRLPSTGGDVEPLPRSSWALLSFVALTRLLPCTGVHPRVRSGAGPRVKPEGRLRRGKRHVGDAATLELRANLVAQAVLVTAKIFRELAR